MGFYSDRIFPRLMDWVMGGEQFQALRHELLKDVRGAVLEIGFGTGLNLPYYPQVVTGLTVVDPATMLPSRVAARLVQALIPVKVAHLSAERLPFEDGVFDCVVSTWTLCTIPDVCTALQEVRRVLKPDGRFLFIEHGRSDDPHVALWQDRLNPVQNVIGCGCNLNRQIDLLVTDAGFTLQSFERFLLPGVPRLGGEMYRGVATVAAPAT